MKSARDTTKLTLHMTVLTRFHVYYLNYFLETSILSKAEANYNLFFLFESKKGSAYTMKLQGAHA